MNKIYRDGTLSYDTVAVSNESGLKCLDDSRTVQADAEDADINNIVKRFGVTGMVPQGFRVPEYQDFGEVFDYRTAIEAVQAAEVNFMKIPAEVRARFQNDPQLFMEFSSQSENWEELVKMGLATAKPREENTVAPAP